MLHQETLKTLIDRNEEISNKYKRLGDNFAKLQEKYERYKLAYTKARESEKKFKLELMELQGYKESDTIDHHKKTKPDPSIYISEKDLGPKLRYAKTPNMQAA